MTDQPHVASAAPGWYPDPSGVPHQQRWWDGYQWGTATQPTVIPYSPDAPTFGSTSPINPTTRYVWILALLPVLGVFNTLLYVALGGFDTVTLMSTSLFSTADLVSYAVSLVVYVLYVIFAYFDQRELTARGLPQPFPWGWGFLPVVYVIGRAVVAYRRTKRGLAPMFVWIGIVVTDWIIGFTIGIIAGLALMNEYSYY